jgi:hypothetical protein
MTWKSKIFTLAMVVGTLTALAMASGADFFGRDW